MCSMGLKGETGESYFLTKPNCLLISIGHNFLFIMFKMYDFNITRYTEDLMNCQVYILEEGYSEVTKLKSKYFC